jgi:benzoyl-CoA reductase subunit C
LFVWGSIIDDQAMMQMIESMDANVVMDDTCVGSRAYFDDVPVTPDPLDGLAQHYLIDIKCPRTFVENVDGASHESFKGYLERRFSYIKDYLRDWKVNGAILESMSYCDIHAYEVPDLKNYLTDLGIPSIYLEPGYNEAMFQPMRMRIQGLLEILH